MTRRRLDAELVRRGLARSRQDAVGLVESGLVTVSGAPAAKVARQVGADEPIVVAEAGDRFVSRAGHKLAAALDAFAVDPDGLAVVDVGSSTGGFTDCVLQRGAKSVAAIDVGRGQLDHGLRCDPRVTPHEQTDVRAVDPVDIGGPFPLLVCDVSFISITRIADALAGLVATGGTAIVLVKPQFEAGRAEASKGRGVIRDPEIWRRAIDEVTEALAVNGLAAGDLIESPTRGAKGNVEFPLLATRVGPDQLGAADAAAAWGDRVSHVVGSAAHPEPQSAPLGRAGSGEPGSWSPMSATGGR